MNSSSSITKWRGWLLFFSVLLLNGGTPQKLQAAIIAALEGPADGQEVAGIGIVRGWAFSDTAGVQITQVTLLVDGRAVTGIPCCTDRADVAAAFPQFPAANTRTSGFGITQNYNLNAPGSHTIGVEIKDSSGASTTLTHTATVVKAGGFEFLDLVDLSAANAQRQGQDLVLSGVRIRDKASQQAARIATRLRWFRNLQGLGLAETTTLGAASSEGSIKEVVKAAQGSSLSPIKASLESPANGQTASGIAIIRGWAFTGQGRSIRKVQLLIDGVPSSTIPCCTARGDVAAAFPGEPNARNSGFGATFNYGLLSSGVHTLAVQIEDSAGASRTLTKGVLVKRPGEFEFLDQLDLRDATVRVAGGALVVEGARAVDKVTSRTATRILRYRWDISAQAFALAEEGVEDVPITNLNCTINGDVSSVNALKTNPGPDGISVAEATQAINNTPNSGSVFVPWLTPGTIQCANPLPGIFRGNITVDGDVDGNGTPDVTLDYAAFSDKFTAIYVAVSDTTVRNLSLINSQFPVAVVARPGTSVSNVAILGIDAALQAGGTSIFTHAQAEAGREAHLSNVLISGNRISGPDTGIQIYATGANNKSTGLTVTGMTVVENTMMGTRGGVSVQSTNSQKGVLARMVIANNSIRSSRTGPAIFIDGGTAHQGGTVVANLLEVEISANEVIDSGQSAILARGGQGVQGNVSGNTLMVDIRENRIEGSVKEIAASGITLEGGYSSTPNSMVSDNVVMGEIQGNEVMGGRGPGVFLTGGWSASKNMVDAMVADNVVTNPGFDGISVYAGTTQPRGDNRDSARNNTVTGMILRNTVQGSTGADIAVFGGFDNSRGEVVGNLALQAISSNTVNRIRCEDGIAGNRAECTLSGNAGIADTMTAREGSSQPEEQSSSAVQTPAPEILPLMERLTSRAEELRNRAQTETDARIQAELLRIVDRLEAMKNKVAARASEQ